MSGRRMSGTSRPSLGAQVLAVFPSFLRGKSQFKKCLERRLEVSAILLPEICHQPMLVTYAGSHSSAHMSAHASARASVHEVVQS